MVALVAGSMVAWPGAAGITPVRDDFTFITSVLLYDSPWEGVRHHWMAFFFRPIDILTGFLIDTETLDSWAALVTQVPAFVAIVLAVRNALKRLTPDVSIVFPLSVLWLLFNNSTAVTLWQTDTVSQVWSGAFGLWLGLLIWDVLEKSASGHSIRKHVAGIVILTTAGMLAKEIFIGWCAGYGGLLLASGIYHLVQGRRRPGAGLLWLAVVVAAIPAVYLVLRMQFGGLEMGVDKYTGEFGVNLIKNIVFGLGGYFTTGPVHVVLDPESYWWAKFLVVAAICVNGVLALTACVLGPPGETNPGRRWIVVGIGVLTFGGISAGFPTSNISEVYVMGPNAGAAVLVALGIGTVVDRCLKRHRGQSHLSRQCMAGFLAAGLVLVAGVYGFVSHAAHFRVTWIYTRGLERAVMDIERSLGRSGEGPVQITLAGQSGFHHSTYVLPPSWVMVADDLEVWVNRHRARNRIRIAVANPGQDTGLTGFVAVGAKDEEIPVRPRW